MKQECQLFDSNILLAFANSKFLITDEMTHAHNLVTMKIDEFYEFICRIAQVAEFNGNAGWTTPPKETEAAEESLKEIPEEQEGAEERKEDKALNPMGQQMLLQDKVFKVIDLLIKIQLRLCRDPNLQLKAKKPTVLGLGDSESDYDSL